MLPPEVVAPVPAPFSHKHPAPANEIGKTDSKRGTHKESHYGELQLPNNSKSLQKKEAKEQRSIREPVPVDDLEESKRVLLNKN